MTIAASFKKRLKYFDLDISFSCAKKNMMVMIGPSGGGKTTIIRMLAGLETPDEGQVIFGDEVWFDSLRHINIPPQKRRLGYVFQDYTLFPHLNLWIMRRLPQWIKRKSMSFLNFSKSVICENASRTWFPAGNDSAARFARRWRGIPAAATRRTFFRAGCDHAPGI